MKTQNHYYFCYCLVFLLYPIIGRSQQTESKDTRTFQFSVVPPVGSYGQFSNKISLNLIAGYGKNVQALEVGGLYNFDRGVVRGVQISGFGNAVGREVNGLQLGGFINTNQGYARGVQIAGFLNLVCDGANGLQLAGFSNKAGEMRGFQLAGFHNYNRSTEGAQLAGFINNVGDLDGFQMAGFINVAREVKGVQFSVVNVADSIASGVQFGLLNFSKKNGFISPGIESDDVIPYRLAFRSGLDKFYSVLTAGVRVDEYWSFGAGFGSRLFLWDKRPLFINPELRWHYMSEGGIKSDENNHLIKFNLNVGYQISKHLYLTAGPSVNLYITNQFNESGNPVINIASNPFWDEKRGNNRYQMWIGYTIGIGF